MRPLAIRTNPYKNESDSTSIVLLYGRKSSNAQVESLPLKCAVAVTKVQVHRHDALNPKYFNGFCSLATLIPSSGSCPMLTPRNSAPPEALPPAAQMAGGETARPIVALCGYLMQTEVHTYAFSVAANSILSLCPFLVMMFTVAQRVFHSRAMVSAIVEMVRYILPAGQEFVARNMAIVANERKSVQLASLLMLAISSTGIFLPLETALNRVWGVGKNRSYFVNQIISLSLAISMGILATVSVALTALQRAILRRVFFGHTHNFVYALIAHSLLQFSAVMASILMFFLIYWILPRRKLPIGAVLPTAIVVGLLWEVAKRIYIGVLPWLDFRSIYGPFSISVSLMMWAFLTGLLLLAGAQHSATRHARRLARQTGTGRA